MKCGAPSNNPDPVGDLPIPTKVDNRKMKFGLFHSVQLADAKQQQKFYQEAMEQVLWAEQLGFDSVWITEHHFTRHGIVSATLSVLAYLAGLTSTIRLGTAVSVLPFHNPIQLAEQAATVDLLSNGRLDLNQSQGEMRIRRIAGEPGRTDFNVRTGELYLAALTCPHHLGNVVPTLALV